MKLISLIAGAALIVGCSARGGYEGVQTSVRNECARLPPSQYEACLEDANLPFEAYEREREALRNTEESQPRGAVQRE